MVSASAATLASESSCVDLGPPIVCNTNKLTRNKSFSFPLSLSHSLSPVSALCAVLRHFSCFSSSRKLVHGLLPMQSALARGLCSLSQRSKQHCHTDRHEKQASKQAKPSQAKPISPKPSQAAKQASNGHSKSFWLGSGAFIRASPANTKHRKQEGDKQQCVISDK